MRSLRLTLFLLQPSLFSGVVGTLCAVTVLVLASRAFLAHNELLSHYFFGSGGLVTTLQTTPSGLGSLWRTLLAHRIHSGVASYLFILSITVVIYTVLEAFTLVGGDIEQAARDAHNARSQAKLALAREIVRRSALRVAIGLIGFVYLLLLWRIIWPACISLSRYGIGAHHWWDVVLSVLYMTVAIHIVVVLARLLALRPRVFGGVDEAVLIEMKH